MQHISIIELVSLYNHYKDPCFHASSVKVEYRDRRLKIKNEIDKRVDNITFK